jgi:hypothetical protein
VAQNQPLVAGESGAALHDPTFWQPLALTEKAAHGLPAIPSVVQDFADAQWGHVRGFALRRSAQGDPVDPGPPAIGLAEDRSYKQAALAVIRATAAPAQAAPGSSPLAWNKLADSLPDGAGAAARLRRDVEVSFALNAALSDAAIATWGAKRVYQSPRPISMIRYLASQGPSGLPLFPGLTRLVAGEVEVRTRWGWVAAASWTPPQPTPPSPGWVAAGSAFAYAADAALTALTGRSFELRAQQASRAGVAAGIQVPADEAGGRRLGTTVGGNAVALARRYFRSAS